MEKVDDPALGGEVTFTPCELVDWFGPDSRWQLGPTNSFFGSPNKDVGKPRELAPPTPHPCGSYVCSVVAAWANNWGKQPPEEVPF